MNRIVAALVPIVVLLVATCTTDPASPDDTDSSSTDQPEAVAVNGDGSVALSAVSTEMLAAGEPVTISLGTDSATVRYQAANDTLEELIQLATGADTVTWFKRVASAKRQAGDATPVPRGTWWAFAQRIGDLVYALSATGNAAITMTIAEDTDGARIDVATTGTVRRAEETTAPKTMEETLPASAPLSQRIRGVWLGTSTSNPMWVWVKEDSIAYSYVDGERTVYVQVDYSLSGSTLKGDEWEMIDTFPRVTKLSFDDDTLVLDITNDVPDGFSPGPREVYRMLPYSGAYPPPQWPRTGSVVEPGDDDSTSSSRDTVLAEKMQGTWYDATADLWLTVDADSIAYAYPDGACYTYYICDYSLAADTLKGSEWESIGSDPAYPRLTRVYFAGDTLVLDITNDVPEGFENGPREVYRGVEYSGTLPLARWPSEPCGQAAPSRPVSGGLSIEGTWSVVGFVQDDGTVEQSPSPDMMIIRFDSTSLIEYHFDEEESCHWRFDPNPYTLSGSTLEIAVSSYELDSLYELSMDGDTLRMRDGAKGFDLKPFTGDMDALCSQASTGDSVACDYASTGSSLNLAGECDLLSRIWGPGSNGIVIGGGLNFSTEPGVGWSQEYDSIFVTSYCITGESVDYITSSSSVSVRVEGPAGSIIEVFDLEDLQVVATNQSSPGQPVVFEASPNRRYGGFAWYEDNAQKEIPIYASLN